jgi:hypothetical protein
MSTLDVAIGGGDVGGEHGGTGGEVPEVGSLHGTLVGAPDELLDGVVVGQTDLLGLSRRRRGSRYRCAGAAR